MSDDAIKAEAAGETTFPVKWRDLTFDLPLDRAEWSFEAGLALEEGKMFVAIRELLSEDQYAQFIERKPKGKDAGDIINGIVSGLGVDSAGESAASSA